MTIEITCQEHQKPFDVRRTFVKNLEGKCFVIYSIRAEEDCFETAVFETVDDPYPCGCYPIEPGSEIDSVLTYERYDCLEAHYQKIMGLDDETHRL